MQTIKVLSEKGRTKVDKSDDSEFYSSPRFVHHVDEKFRARLTQLYAQYLRDDMFILDLMSSWVSHLPELKFKHVEGLGLNEKELARNPQLNHYFVQNLNLNTKLSLDSNFYDAVIIAVSVQYLQQPEQIFSEIHRVLKKGGVCIISFSNRMFPTKAIREWKEGDDASHVNLVQTYFKSVPNGFEKITTVVEEPNDSDPFFAVIAFKNN